MNFSFPKINKIEIIGLNLNERTKIESIINDAKFKNIFDLDKQYLKEKIDSINIIKITGVISIDPKFGIILLMILSEGSTNLKRKFIIMDMN